MDAFILIAVAVGSAAVSGLGGIYLGHVLGVRSERSNQLHELKVQRLDLVAAGLDELNHLHAAIFFRTGSVTELGAGGTAGIAAALQLDGSEALIGQFREALKAAQIAIESWLSTHTRDDRALQDLIGAIGAARVEYERLRTALL